MPATKDVRQRTYEDLLEKLNQHHKCALIRPTGFGKTWMLTSLIQEPQFKTILYLYPIQVIKNTVVAKYFDDIEDVSNATDEDNFTDEETLETLHEMQEIENVILMTYNKLARLSVQEIKDMSFDLVIFDEVHRIGAPKTKAAVSKLFAYNADSYFVGATATPNRTDAFDVVNTFFNDITVFEYNAHDAFQDGLLLKPYYCYCTYDINGDVKNSQKNIKEPAFIAGKDFTDKDTVIATEIFNKKLIEISHIYNMEHVIQETCTNYLPSTDYMKFIVFFSTMSQMDDKSESVEYWFKKAFPSHKISSLTITSKNTKTAKNVDKLENLVPRPNRIDLIYCIDMLNMGYHVNDLSGILMYRGTSSDIIYIQQLGRALSSGAENPCIVFDVVDNLHRKAVFDLQVNNTKLTKTKKKNTTISCGWHVNDQGKIVDKDGDEAPVKINVDGTIVDLLDNKTNFVLNDDNTVTDKNDYEIPDWKLNSNTILPEDIIATGHEATYRELIAKLVAEPIHQRCKMAITAHFERWCKKHKYKYPITDEELKSLYGTSKEDFKKEFVCILKANKLNYPLQDAAKLLAIGEAKGIPPLRMFARIRNVSIEQILDLLDLSQANKAS